MSFRRDQIKALLIKDLRHAGLRWDVLPWHDLPWDEVMSHAHNMRLIDNKTYRVSIEDNIVKVVCFGTNNYDVDDEGWYGNINELPMWMQDRLANLYMLEPKHENEVAGVGRRIGKNIFWLFK
jgi:hypothetical protein|tara:strand:- start:53 stop:421 length:369 start_codon:yes stop_codon:yes gene_type:complete